MTRLACIDVGSNTTRLLVAEAGPEGLEPLVNERVFTLIGKSLAGGDRIPAEKIEEVAAVVAAQVEQARELGAERVRAVATAAIRLAANAQELVGAVGAAAGVELEVLSGDEEARLAFAGAARAFGGGGRLAVIDVGGGSTEIAVGDTAGGIDSVTSVAIGSSQLTERHFRFDPPSEDELHEAREAVKAVFNGFAPEAVDSAVAIGGSASSLQILAGQELGEEEFREALNLLSAEPSDILAQQFGLEPVRVRMLPAGLLVLAELSRRLGKPLRICKGGLREGAIMEMIGSPD